MNAKELRIGNWLEWDNEYYQIEIGSFYTQLKSEDGRRLFNEIKPIPLTPEILKKAGFRKINYYDGNSFGLKISDSHEFVCNERVFYLACDDSFYNEVLDHIKYLHQLQNLYFALTGEELNIEL